MKKEDVQNLTDQVREFVKDGGAESCILMVGDKENSSAFVLGSPIDLTTELACLMHKNRGMVDIFKNAIEAFENVSFDAEKEAGHE